MKAVWRFCERTQSLVTEMETLQQHLFDVADKKHGWCPWRALMLRIHPSLCAAQLLSVLKAGFLLYWNYHLHNNTPCVYTPLTLPCIPPNLLLSPQCGTYHYTVHAGKEGMMGIMEVVSVSRRNWSSVIRFFLLLQDWLQTGTIWCLVSVSGQVKDLQLSSPLPLTSILAPLILPVSVYKHYTFWQLPWCLKS